MIGNAKAVTATIDREVGDILDRHWLLVWGRVAITFMFWFAGIGFLLNFPEAVGMMRGYGPSRRGCWPR